MTTGKACLNCRHVASCRHNAKHYCEERLPINVLFIPDSVYLNGFKTLLNRLPGYWILCVLYFFLHPMISFLYRPPVFNDGAFKRETIQDSDHRNVTEGAKAFLKM